MEKLRKEVRAKKAVYTRSLIDLNRLITEAGIEVEISLCIDSVKEKKASLSASHEKLLTTAGEEEMQSEIDSFAELETRERTYLSQAAQRMIQTREASPTEPQPTATIHPHLEKIEIPTFHGDPRRYTDRQYTYCIVCPCGEGPPKLVSAACRSVLTSLPGSSRERDVTTTSCRPSPH